MCQYVSTTNISLITLKCKFGWKNEITPENDMIELLPYDYIVDPLLISRNY